MANTVVSPQIGFNLSSQLTLVPTGGVQNATIPISDSTSTAYTVGTATANINIIYSATITIASSGSSTTLTLSSLTDPGGASIAFAHISAWKVTNLDVTQTVTVKPGASNGITWLPTAGVAIPPGTASANSALCMSVPPGLACVASTSDQLTLSIGAGTNILANLTLFGRTT